MSTKKYTFVAPHSRRMADPNWPGVNRHIFFVPLRKVPSELPMGANPRSQNTDLMVYRQVEESMLAEDRMFHLKHKGMTIVASSVELAEGSKDTFIVEFDDESKQGVLDGGHTYSLIIDNRDDLPEDQYVKMEILTGVDPEWIPDVAGGLNTSVQVQPMSLFNLREQFEWIKDELRQEPYFDKIAWRENERREYDARDIISLLYCFNVFAFPNADMQRFPISAYSSKAAVLKEWSKNQDQFKLLRPILKDILVFSDTMSCEAKELYNRAEAGHRGGRAHFIEHRDSTHKPFHFTFLGTTGHDRLMTGALYPMLASFRWMVEVDENTGLARWKKPFPEIVAMWEELAGELFLSTLEQGRDLGYNVNALGKNKGHWSNLYRAVVVKDLMHIG